MFRLTSTAKTQGVDSLMFASSERDTREPARPKVCERATATLLVPIGVLILVLLASIAVDLSAISMAQRDLQDVVSSAASDAASSLDDDAIRSGAGTAIRLDQARRIAEQEIRGAQLPGELSGPIEIEVLNGGQRLRIAATLSVPYIFGGPFRQKASATVRAVGEAEIDVR